MKCKPNRVKNRPKPKFVEMQFCNTGVKMTITTSRVKLIDLVVLLFSILFNSAVLDLFTVFEGHVIRLPTSAARVMNFSAIFGW